MVNRKCSQCKYRTLFSYGNGCGYSFPDGSPWDGWGCGYMLTTNEQRKKDKEGNCLSYVHLKKNEDT